MKDIHRERGRRDEERDKERDKEKEKEKEKERERERERQREREKKKKKKKKERKNTHFVAISRVSPQQSPPLSLVYQAMLSDVSRLENNLSAI